MVFQNRCKTEGFTLIELLIVVAIIAILAAIAVPNFLEAQTRAKVSRVKADMRTLATAIEAYAVDQNRYPIVADETGEPILPYPDAGPNEIFETRLSVVITTPIAYISSRLNETFPEREDLSESPQFGYLTRDFAAAFLGSDIGSEDFEQYADFLGFEGAGAEYYLLSHGPDRIHNEPGDLDNPADSEAALYDPTNGTVSSGDILYFGPGQAFGD